MCIDQHPAKALAGRLLPVLALVCAVAVPAAANTLIADCNNPATNLQTVMDSANNGDTVQVNGRCVGSFDMRLSCVTLTGPATLDGVGTTHPVLTIGNACVSLPATVSNLNIINGRANLGAGIRDITSNNITITLNNLFISDNESQFGGGLVTNPNSNVTINNSVFHNDRANLEGGGIFNLGILTIHNSTFTHNVAGSLGGGLRNNSSSSAPVTITGSTFDDNTIFGQGGGTAIENAGTMEVTDSTIFGNSARIPSSAESISNVGDLTLTNTGVIYNEQGIVNLRGSLELVDCND